MRLRLTGGELQLDQQQFVSLAGGFHFLDERAQGFGVRVGDLRAWIRQAPHIGE